MPRARRRRLSPVIAVVVLGALVGPAIPAARADVADVGVHNDFFKPQRIRIEPGDTVRWNVVDGDHTITADDGSFRFPADGFGSVVAAGDEYEFTFPRRGLYLYHCELHGQSGQYPRGMTGAVYVGIDFEGDASEVRRVPSEYPTIADAQAGLAPGSTILLAPGVYEGNVNLRIPNATLRGEGDSPDDVVLVGETDTFDAAVEVTGSGAAVENLSIRAGPFDGLLLDAVKWFRVRDVWVEGGTTAIRTAGSTSGSLVGVRATRAGVGVTVMGCNPCGVVVVDPVVTASGTAVRLDAISGAVLRGLTASGNAVGVSVGASQGIDVEQSTISGGNTGIRVSAGILPPVGVRIRDNTVTGYRTNGLEWDLVGVRVCFSGNTDPAQPDGVPASQPPLLQTLFPCA